MGTIVLSAEDLQKSRKKADMETALQSLIGVIPDARLSLESYRTERLNCMESSCSKDELVRNAWCCIHISLIYLYRMERQQKYWEYESMN